MLRGSEEPTKRDDDTNEGTALWGGEESAQQVGQDRSCAREERSGARDDLPCEQGYGYALGFGFGFSLSLIVERNTLGSFASLIHPSVWKVDSPNFALTAF